MFNALRSDAVKRVWCSPDQDNQYLIELRRVTQSNGGFGNVDLHFNHTDLPTVRGRQQRFSILPNDYKYHLFMMSGKSKESLGLNTIGVSWKSVDQLITDTDTMIDIIFSDGVQFPRGLTYIKQTTDGTILIALKDYDVMATRMSLESPLVRVYTNTFYHSIRRGNTGNRGTQVYTYHINSLSDVANAQVKATVLGGEVGTVTTYVDGIYVSKAINGDGSNSGEDVGRANIGSIVELVFDPSVFRRTSYKVDDLPTFTSTLDSAEKYLVHTPKAFDRNTIEFEDDIDVFVYQEFGTTAERRGLTYHKPLYSWLRHLTHQDYSIPSAVVYRIWQAATALGIFTDTIENTFVEFVHRRSGLERDLIVEKTRLKDLYLLDDDMIVQTMLGQGSSIGEWFAPTLENAIYPKMMRLRDPGKTFTDANLVSLYGYHGITEVFGKTPFRHDYSKDALRFTINTAQIGESVSFQYDGDGNYQGSVSHGGNSNRAVVINDTVEIIELITGAFSTSSDIEFGNGVVVTEPRYQYRAYLCELINGVPDWKWRDVTDDPGTMLHANGTLTIDHDPATEYVAALSDKNVVVRGYTLGFSNGLLEFTVDDLQTHSTYGNQIKQIPPRKVDVFLNDKVLIQNLDYVVIFPKIIITNKDYLLGDESTQQHVVVRMTGFCDPTTMDVDDPREVGFVKGGYLSDNSKFDAHDGKSLYTIINGGIRMLDDYQTFEEHSGLATVGLAEGTPYAIREQVIPFRNTQSVSTVDLRNEDVELEKKISAYLTAKLPMPASPDLITIPSKYNIVSPMLVRILHDLEANIIPNDRIMGVYSDTVVIELTESYNYLLAFEPSMRGIDTNFVSTHPHKWPNRINIPFNHLKFLERVNKLRLNNEVNVNQYFTATFTG